MGCARRQRLSSSRRRSCLFEAKATQAAGFLFRPRAVLQVNDSLENHHGRLHNRGNGARCTMAKSGGIFYDNDAFARVYNNFVLHEYIYYFTLVHF